MGKVGSKSAREALEYMIDLYMSKDWASLRPLMTDRVKVEFRTSSETISAIITADQQIQTWDKNLQGRRVQFNLLAPMDVTDAHGRFLIQVISRNDYYWEESGDYDFSERIHYTYFMKYNHVKGCYQATTLHVDATSANNEVVLNRSPVVKANLYRPEEQGQTRVIYQATEE